MTYPELRLLMFQKGEKQEDLAKILGITQGMISKRLNKKIRFTLLEKKALARHYHKSVDELGL